MGLRLQSYLETVVFGCEETEHSADPEKPFMSEGTIVHPQDQDQDLDQDHLL